MRLEQARLRPLLLAVFIALVLGRVPTLTIHPRFWAEEGGLFLNYAYAHSIWQARTTSPRSQPGQDKQNANQMKMVW